MRLHSVINENENTFYIYIIQQQQQNIYTYSYYLKIIVMNGKYKILDCGYDVF